MPTIYSNVCTIYCIQADVYELSSNVLMIPVPILNQLVKFNQGEWVIVKRQRFAMKLIFRYPIQWPHGYNNYDFRRATPWRCWPRSGAPAIDWFRPADWGPDLATCHVYHCVLSIGSPGTLPAVQCSLPPRSRAHALMYRPSNLRILTRYIPSQTGILLYMG